MRFAKIAVSALALTALFNGTEAWAQDHAHDAASGDALVIEVNMADYSFAPEPLRIPAGQLVQLVFTNTGEVEHEFMAGRTVTDGDFAVDLFAGLEVVMGTVVPAGHDNSDGHHDDDADAPADHDDSDGHQDDDAGAPADHDNADEHLDAAAAVPAGHDNSDGHHDGDDAHGTMVLLEEGGQATMTFTLPIALRGEWETGCFLTGHYGRGMHGTLTVY